MCGLYFSNYKNVNDETLHLLNSRGPDSTNTIKLDEFFITHTLLSMTGEFTTQPLIDDELVILFNGEIYNYQDNDSYKSDIFKIKEAYLNSKELFFNELDGEFAIILLDLKESKLFFGSDLFGTKPLYYYFKDQEFQISSYAECINSDENFSIRCKPNEMYIYDIKNRKLEIKQNIHKFKLDQNKENFDDWNIAFINAIKKRFLNAKHDIILPLSAGHDSGSIACAMDLLNIKYDTFSFIGKEDKVVLNQRLDIKRSSNNGDVYLCEMLSDQQRNEIKEYMLKNCSDINYGPNHSEVISKGIDDNGAHGLTFLLRESLDKNDKIRILASGQGGDEIYGNLQFYSFGKPNPKKFPRNINKVFPWENFYYGAQSSYLGKEESISGSFGIESRYPLLDKQVVQEFLSLKHKLKNKYFKSPVTNFLKENNYPFLTGNPVKFKTGFNV